MKKILSLLTLLLLTVSTQAKTYPTPISWIFVRSLPIVLTSIVEGSLPAFWAAMAAAGAVDVLIEMTEPEPNYKAGIKHVVGATSAEITYVDWEYPARDLDAERVYDYDPFTNTETWWIKSTFTVRQQNGTSETTTTYSQTAPTLRDFRMEDIKYRRIGLSGAHQTSFSYDAYEKVVCFCARMGSKPWGRPLIVRTTGNEFVKVFRNDIGYESPTILYQDDHYCFVGPASLGLGAMVQWKPYWPDGKNVQVHGVSTVTML